MKYVSASEGVKVQNSDSCEVLELGNINTIDGADIDINGRYPETGYAVNQQSDLVIRVLSGRGELVTKETNATLSSGDAAFVKHGEPYYFEGKSLKLFMACTPAWNMNQYKEVE